MNLIVNDRENRALQGNNIFAKIPPLTDRTTEGGPLSGVGIIWADGRQLFLDGDEVAALEGFLHFFRQLGGHG